jgi:hypothetical protein
VGANRSRLPTEKRSCLTDAIQRRSDLYGRRKGRPLSAAQLSLMTDFLPAVSVMSGPIDLHLMFPEAQRFAQFVSLYGSPHLLQLVVQEIEFFIVLPYFLILPTTFKSYFRVNTRHYPRVIFLRKHEYAVDEIGDFEKNATIKLGISLLIPEDYMSDLSLRMSFYKKISYIKNLLHLY